MELIELAGRRLACWDRGQGTPLLFIHGVGTAGELWAGDLEALASDCRLIVYDRRGYGASSESPRDWEAHRDDAADLIEALDAVPAVVVGFSGGAAIALDLVVSRPELVSRLVLLDPAFNIKRCVTPGLVRAMATARLLRRVRGDGRGAAAWMRYTGSYPSGGSAFDKVPAARRQKLLSNASGVFADADSGGGDHVPEDRLSAIAVPTTIVDCAMSPPFLRKSCGRLRALMPQATTVTFERSGHHIGVDARDELLALLRSAVSPRQESAPR
jgi:pimeloyl-ACP methyl ester carboxylesterase